MSQVIHSNFEEIEDAVNVSASELYCEKAVVISPIARVLLFRSHSLDRTHFDPIAQPSRVVRSEKDRALVLRLDLSFFEAAIILISPVEPIKRFRFTHRRKRSQN